MVLKLAMHFCIKLMQVIEKTKKNSELIEM